MRIAPGGIELVAVLFALSLATAIVGFLIPSVLIGLSGVFLLVFYRDPSRQPAGTGIVSPADGRIHSIDTGDDGRLQMVIFLNIWDVHVVRSPWDGQITDRQRRSGYRRPAFLAGAAKNAGVEYAFEDGLVTLRAGMFARRVRPYREAGSTVDRGERIGHIAFGSRVDVTFPSEFDRSHLTITLGERVKAGSTIVATKPAG